MKAAFAKMMEKNPTQSSQIAFRAGGNGVPILTRASGQPTTGYQTMGLPGGSMPTPGGGANKTTLGAIRMGDQDGNAPGSAIFPNDIFYPPGQPEREYPERTFANIGNNVYQPENNDLATHALLRRLGDQKFKAVSEAPFEDYRAQQRLARDIQEASRNASLNDLGVSREIIRNLAAERRQQNEDDYLRKMMDAGATPEAARKEIEDVRNANAIQEAKKVEDREYQAKTLIQRIAMSRGVTPMTREPLNQSSSIDNPQRSQAMSQAMGMPGEGFGTSPLDMNRQFMTPDFYRKFLRKSNISQESADEQQAFNSLLSRNELPLPDQGAFSFATLKGQERQAQIEMASEGLAARLDTIRARANRIIKALPTNLIGKDILDDLYRQKGKVKGKEALYSLETIEDMRPLQLLVALNLATVALPKGYDDLNRQMNGYSFGSPDRPSTTLMQDLKELVIFMNKGEPTIAIPFASAQISGLTNAKIVNLLQEVKNGSQTLRREAAQAHEQYMREVNIDDIPLSPGPALPIARNNMTAEQLRAARLAALERRNTPRMDEAPEPGAPAPAPAAEVGALVGGGGGGGEAVRRYTKPEVEAMSAAAIKDLLRAKGLGVSGNKQKLVDRFFASQ